jgi:predicted SAM-dependent methyltransferase
MSLFDEYKKIFQRKIKYRDFDDVFYLDFYPDVMNAVKSGVFKNGYDHFYKHGKFEGRFKNRLEVKGSRDNFVFKLINQDGKGLEIGPSHNPLAPKSKGFDVDIVDHLSTQELIAKYSSHNVDLSRIEKVDYVWVGGSLTELIGEKGKYDYIIASHVIEHLPDPISFIRDCLFLLKPKGVLSLVIPDKRFCFDYFQQISTTGQLVDAFLRKTIQPSPGQILDHHLNASASAGRIAWAQTDKLAKADSLVHSFDEAKLIFENSISDREYVDVHCWRFTPESFELVMKDLINLDLIALNLESLSATNGCEFYASFISDNSVNLSISNRSRFDLLNFICKA